MSSDDYDPLSEAGRSFRHLVSDVDAPVRAAAFAEVRRLSRIHGDIPSHILEPRFSIRWATHALHEPAARNFQTSSDETDVVDQNCVSQERWPHLVRRPTK